MLAGVGEADGPAGQPLRRRVGQDLPRAGRGLDPGRGVYRIPGHHPLADCAQVDRHLAGDHARSGGQARHASLGAQLAHRGDEVQRGSDCPLGVSLRRRRGSPYRHHRVADELLDRSAVAADHRPRHPEVAGQQLADRLGIPRLGQWREAHQVTEQHRAHPAFGHRLVVRQRSVPDRWGGPGRQLETAGPAETITGNDLLTTRWARP
jgi:hypothetical protein